MNNKFKVGDYVVFVGNIEKEDEMNTSKDGFLISKITEIIHLPTYEKLRLNYGFFEFTDSSKYYRLATEKEVRVEKLKSIFMKKEGEWDEKKLKSIFIKKIVKQEPNAEM